MKIMKLTLLIFPMLAAQQAFSMQSNLRIRPLSEPRIQVYQSKIEKKLALHAKTSATLAVAGIGMTGLSMYKMVRELVSVTQVIGVKAQSTETPIPWQDKAAVFAKKFGWFCAETAAAIAVNKIISDLMAKVMHDNSLAWWITTHAPYQQSIELMEEIAIQYVHAMHDADAKRHQKRFVGVANALMVQCEQIIAFMRHKSTVGTATSKTLKHEIAAVMSERVSALSAELNVAIDAGDAQELWSLLRKFKNEFNQDLIRFAYNDQ